MKKIYIVLLLLLTTYLIGCDLFSQTKTDATENQITTTSTMESSEEILEILQEEYEYLISFIPIEITQDILLPQSRDELITLEYLQDGVILSNSTFVYTPSIEGISSELEIKLTYQEEILTQTVTIYLVENETEFYNNQIIEVFSLVDQVLNTIPKIAESDFLLPDIDIEGLYIEYSVSQSYIYNDYFVFPFNAEDSFLKIDVLCTYRGVTYQPSVEVKLLSLDHMRNIPRIYIETNNGEAVTEKETYVGANFSLYAFSETNEAIPLVVNEAIEMRCRGNSTFYMPKFSYKLEFNSKTPLLFDYSEKDWVLLANFTDQTLIRNYLANNLSSNLNMAFSPSAAFVDVYLNGDYIGNYMLSDHIKVTNDRVDIEEHSTNIDTGYLLEFDKRLLESWADGTEGVDYFLSYGIPFAVKSPKIDELSQDQFDFIKNYIDETLYILNNGLDYSSYIDIDSFVDWFIINEVFQNVDSGYSSVFLYKDAGGLLKMGPIWDFDLSAGNPGHLGDDLRQPEGRYTSLQYKNLFYYYLMEYESFRFALKTRWNEVYVKHIRGMIESIYPVSQSISKSRYLNFEVWDVIGSWEDWYTAPEILEADTYQKQLEFLYNFLDTRAKWLNKEINYF